MDNKVPDIRLALQGEGIETLIPNPETHSEYFEVKRAPRGNPLFVAFPESHEQIQKTIEIIGKFKQGIVVKAGNTAFDASQVADNEIVLDVKYFDNLNAIKLKNGDEFKFSQPEKKMLKDQKADVWEAELKAWMDEKQYTKKDFADATVDAQSGLSVGSLNHVLRVAGLEFPIDTGAVSKGAGMTIGAAGAKASHGTYGLLHGTGSNLVKGGDSVRGNGTEWQFENPPLTDRVIDRDKTAIDSAVAQFGHSPLATHGMLSVITDMQLYTTQIPEQRHLIMLKIDDPEQVNSLVETLWAKGLKQNLRQYELMDKESLDMVKHYHKDGYINPFGKKEDPIGSEYVLMAEFISHDINEPLIEKVVEIFETDHDIQKLGINTGDFAYSGEREEGGRINTEGGKRELFTKLRHSITGSSDGYAGTLGGTDIEHRITPDVSVPLNELNSFIKDIKELSEKRGLKHIKFGHIGIGAFHLHIFSEENLTEKESNGLTRGQNLLKEVFDIVKKHRGSCWSEHGVGPKGGALWEEYTSRDQVDMLIAMKLENDPNCVLSPRSNNMKKHIEAIKNDPERLAEIKRIAEVCEFKNALATIESFGKSASEDKFISGK